MAVEYSDVGFNSSLLLSWFDLSTPVYGLSNKAWREHSTAIWNQQGRPVKGIIVPKSGHATAYVERFVCVILRRLGPFALRTGKKHSGWCISLSV